MNTHTYIHITNFKLSKTSSEINMNGQWQRREKYNENISSPLFYLELTTMVMHAEAVNHINDNDRNKSAKRSAKENKHMIT